MMCRQQKTEPPALQRFEAKFTIPVDMIEPLSYFVETYCTLDTHSQHSADHFYRVNNLYFDTPNYLFLMRRIDQAENRFNMRVRTYSDTVDTPCFFELKQRNVNVIRKYRAAVHDPAWPRLLQELGCNETSPASNDDNTALFLTMAAAWQAEPKVLSQYRRKAYVSDVDDYARVTFDRDLRCQPARGYSLLPDTDAMVPLDHEHLFDQGCSVVLELKCYTTRVPLWMVDLIRTFDLRRRSFSKYMTGVFNVSHRYRHDPGLRMAILDCCAPCGVGKNAAQ